MTLETDQGKSDDVTSTIDKQNVIREIGTAVTSVVVAIAQSDRNSFVHEYGIRKMVILHNKIEERNMRWCHDRGNLCHSVKRSKYRENRDQLLKATYMRILIHDGTKMGKQVAFLVNYPVEHEIEDITK